MAGQKRKIDEITSPSDNDNQTNRAQVLGPGTGLLGGQPPSSIPGTAGQVPGMPAVVGRKVGTGEALGSENSRAKRGANKGKKRLKQVDHGDEENERDENEDEDADEGEDGEGVKTATDNREVTAGPSRKQPPARKQYQRRRRGDPEPDYSETMRQKLKSAKRTGQACDRCRVRKLRCDRNPRGCSQCDAAGVPCNTTDRATGTTQPRGALQECEQGRELLRQENTRLRAEIEQLRQENTTLRQQLLVYENLFPTQNVDVPNEPPVRQTPTYWPPPGANDQYHQPPYNAWSNNAVYGALNNFPPLTNQFAPNLLNTPGRYDIDQILGLPPDFQPIQAEDIPIPADLFVLSPPANNPPLINFNAGNAAAVNPDPADHAQILLQLEQERAELDRLFDLAVSDITYQNQGGNNTFQPNGLAANNVPVADDGAQAVEQYTFQFPGGPSPGGGNNDSQFQQNGRNGDDRPPIG